MLLPVAILFGLSAQETVMTSPTSRITSAGNAGTLLATPGPADTTPMVTRHELDAWLARELQVHRIRDYCPNGLQVEGRAEIRRVIAGVTASEALLQEAVRMGADAVLVHHGWFWKSDDVRVIGTRRRRLKLALSNDINVFAYHLPLDLHPRWGNNAQLARVLGLAPDLLPDDDASKPGQPLTAGPEGLLWIGRAPGLSTVGELAERVAQRLQREPLVIGDRDAPVGRVVWCTGAAQNMMEDAVAVGATVYITGEASEQTTHMARETGVAFIGAGHHATERYGVQALGEAVARQFGVEVRFIDIDNPV